MTAEPFPQPAATAARLAKIADYLIRTMPLDERLIRRGIWNQAEEEGLVFDRAQVNAAIRRAWNRLSDEERDAARRGLLREPASGGSYNQDEDNDETQDQDQAQGTTATNGKIRSVGQPTLAAPPKLSRLAEEPEVYDLLERYRLGQLQPHPVQLGPMPQDATDSMARVAEDIALLIGLRLAVDDDRPLIYSTSFCAWRMGWSKSTGEPDKPRASRVLRKLIDAAVIEFVGMMPRTDTRLFVAPSAGIHRPPRPEVPAIGRHARVQPAVEVDQQTVVHQAQAVGGDDLGVIASGDCALPRHDCSSPDSGRKLHSG